MPEDSSNSARKPWTSTHKEILDREKEKAGNKVWESEEHQIQEKLKVAVYSDTEKIKLDIYRIDIDTLSYNFENGRLWKEKRKACKKHGIPDPPGLEETNPDHQDIVHELLLTTESYSDEKTEDLKKDLKKKKQEDPCLITEFGVIWNGNRRVACMKDLYKETTDADWKRVLVCFLPNGMTLPKLRNLEKRYQEDPETKQAYGRVNQMGRARDKIDDFRFASGNYQTATADEQKELLEVVGVKGEFDTWGKLLDAKTTVDLMDYYLKSRDGKTTDGIGEVTDGDYESIEKAKGESGVTWFDDLGKLLRAVVARYEDTIHGQDPDQMRDAYRTSLLNRYDAGDNDREELRKLTILIKKATGTGTPDDTTPQLETHELNDEIIHDWKNQSSRPENELINNTELGEGTRNNLQNSVRAVQQHGQDPKKVLAKIKRQIADINKDLVNANDAELITIIEACRKELEKIEARAK